ncbi:EF-Tu/IF-2/RF-3 family GTPase, partial [Campylobacter concisus]|uniref:EF-Tu/IF-2/RF-3 family GTPase n=1 Tax=Campylobacter concisus TaxID=199 RepID=UPI00215632DA
YRAAKNGYAKLKLRDENKDMPPPFETILAHVPAPSGSDENPLQLQVFTLDYDKYVGKIGIARIFNGKIAKNQNVMLAKADGTKTTGRISKLIGFMGLDRIDINEAGTGDIVAIAGFDALDVGDSVVDPNNPHPLDPLHIEEPTLS